MCQNSKSHRGHVIARLHVAVDSSRGDRLNTEECKYTEACICIVVWNAVFMHCFVAFVPVVIDVTDRQTDRSFIDIEKR